MSRSPDWETPVQDMDSEEIMQNIEAMLSAIWVSCDREELETLHTTLGGAEAPMKHSCPDCGEMITKDECPKEAPDFVCEPCHLERYKNIPAWREETDQRRNEE